MILPPPGFCQPDPEELWLRRQFSAQFEAEVDRWMRKYRYLLHGPMDENDEP